MVLRLPFRTTFECLLSILFCICLSGVCRAQAISLSEEQASWVLERVFANECSAPEECLIAWNPGERFLSLGFGHFIWYPRGLNEPFEESFPKFLSFAFAAGDKLPEWLDPQADCPWVSRDEFLASQGDPRVSELREFLLATKARQASFLIERMKEARPLILANAAEDEREKISHLFSVLASTPQGLFIIIDYINFKGTGLSETERYQGQGWGLLQVLSLMQEKDSSRAAQEEFVRAAKLVLERRIDNAPPRRREDRWFKGWVNRLESYLK